MKSAHAIKTYQTPYPHPLIIKSGDSLQLIDKKTECPGWVWCVNKDGISAWVPTSYIERIGNLGKALRDYSSKELNVQIGEILTILKEESGWAWCMNQNGEEGWVPKECIRVRTDQ
jgi:uncharacterized protein YgiM (DUF1202 family)